MFPLKFLIMLNSVLGIAEKQANTKHHKTLKKPNSEKEKCESGAEDEETVAEWFIGIAEEPFAKIGLKESGNFIEKESVLVSVSKGIMFAFVEFADNILHSLKDCFIFFTVSVLSTKAMMAIPKVEVIPKEIGTAQGITAEVSELAILRDVAAIALSCTRINRRYKSVRIEPLNRARLRHARDGVVRI